MQNYYDDCNQQQKLLDLDVLRIWHSVSSVPARFKVQNNILYLTLVGWVVLYIYQFKIL